MNIDKHEVLEAFYFGKIKETSRLQVERDLLTDPEALIDFLEIKRRIEKAKTVPMQASNRLRTRILDRLSKKEKILLRFLVGALAAACALLFYFQMVNHPLIKSPKKTGILFDSGAEPSRAANVL